MPSEPQEFEPLMSSIERVLEALETQDLSSSLADAANELRERYKEYNECCCRRAHVVPHPESLLR